MTNEQITRLKELSTEATPPPWVVDSEHCHDAGFHSFFIGAGVGLGGKWATLLDTVNSDHTLIRDERNGDGGNVWDVIGEANATLIVELRNALPEIITALESAAAMREALDAYERLLFPVVLTLAERGLLDKPCADTDVLFSFMGSGASDLTTVGHYRRADALARQALATKQADDGTDHDQSE